MDELDVKMVTTNDGLELNAKMETGISLDITRIVAGAGRSGSLEGLTRLEDERAALSITGRDLKGAKAVIYAVLHNKGLEHGFDLTQFGIYAQDPDKGEILYRVSELKNAIPVSAEKNWPTFAVDCRFEVIFSNASTVNATVDPAGSVTASQLDARINALKEELKSGGGKITFSQEEPPDFSEGDLWVKLGTFTEAPEPGLIKETITTAEFDPSKLYHALINGVLETPESLNDGTIIVKML